MKTPRVKPPADFPADSKTPGLIEVRSWGTTRGGYACEAATAAEGDARVYTFHTCLGRPLHELVRGVVYERRCGTLLLAPSW